MGHPSDSLWPLAAAELAALVGGELRGDPTAQSQRVNSDSRSGVRQGDLFVGLRGPRFDGSDFAGQALADGAQIALVATRATATEPPRPGQAVVSVTDPLGALQTLAAEARRRFAGEVVAVTGSNGKTIVKDMLAATLSGARRVAASPMSYNSQVGVALSLLSLDPAVDVALVECGISHPGEMARIEAMVRPDHGVFTHVGDAHLEGLGSRETTAREKADLFRRLPPKGWVVVHEREQLAVAAVRAHATTARTIGSGPHAAFELPQPTTDSEHWTLRHEDRFVVLPLGRVPDFLHIDAALAAAAALLLGAGPAQIEEGLRGWKPAPMRLEMSMTTRGVLLVNDAYSADPDSVDAALRTLQRERSSGQAIAVLAGMAQLGVGHREAHERVGRRVVELKIDRLIGVGQGGDEIVRGALAAGMEPCRAHHASDVGDAGHVLDEHAHPGDRVLLKGSRPARLERLAALLFDSLAPARLYVSLDAIVGNFQRAKELVGRHCGVMAVVKSFGYGLDSVRVARALENVGIDAFAVAYPDEGITLRDRGITRPILVQNVLEYEADKIVRHGLSAQIATPEQVEFLQREAHRHQRVTRVHLKLDTGMARAGATPEQAVGLARAVESSPWLLLEGLMTHFAASDDPAHDEFTRGQLARFDDAVSALDEQGIEPRWIHACNSAAISRFPEAHHTMVRLGLGLFGYSPVGAGLALEQQPALRLVTRVVSVKRVPAGQPVGYGLSFHTGDEPRAIAVVALGYNDGYPWSLSNCGWMTIRGVRCPVVGKVCMDVTLLDVTDLDEAVAPGDEVVVFGTETNEPSLVELAATAGTIPYELLTRLSPRLRRIFRSSLG